MPQVHRIKCWPQYYWAVVHGEKTFEVRKDDRGYQKGDTLILCEWDPRAIVPHFTGHEDAREIKYILTGGQFGIEPGYVILGF